jgi:zinc protease
LHYAPTVGLFGRRVASSSTIAVLLFAVASCSSNQQVSVIRSQQDELTQFDTGERIADDPLTTVTVLDNGLTVFIRENDQPGFQADLRLVINAGSANQTDEQSGVAHFLEHMLFNGTTKYPGNELTETLRSFGMAFGADVNAYTSFDETVYSLTVPTRQDDKLALGVDVLAQWLGEATIDPDEVVDERGVVLSEWRERAQSFSGREFDAFSAMYLENGTFADREPLGTEDAIRNMDAEPLRRFYDDWYRPDNAAVVIVGDIDGDEALELVTEAFGSLQPRSESLPPYSPSLTLSATPRAVVLLDPDAQTAYAEIALPFASTEPTAGTPDERRGGILESVVYSMIDTRLNEDITRGVVDFVDAGTSSNTLVRPLYAPYVYMSGPAEALNSGIETLAVELARAAEFGFDQAEFDRAIRSGLAGVEADFGRSASRSDAELADAAVGSFLGGWPNPSAKLERDLATSIYESLTVEEANEAFAAVFESAVPYLYVSAPESMANPPTEASLIALLDDVANRDLEPREATDEAFTELMRAPAPVTESSTKDLQSGPFLDPVQLTFPNGAVVILNPTSIEDDSVSVIASSPGGISLVDDDRIWDAYAATSVMTSGGLGELDAVQVQQVLSSSTLSLSAYIDYTEEAFVASSSTGDLEQVFQVMHLLMSQPKADKVALDNWVESVQPLIDDPTADPELAGDIAFTDARYGDELRYKTLPTQAQLDAVDLADVEAVFGERFANVGDWVFAVSGDFSMKTVTDLARRYIGSLPATNVTESFVDYLPDAPSEAVRVDVTAGTGELGSLTVLHSAPSTDALLDPIYADLLSSVLTNRLTDEVREALGASYSPGASVYAMQEPDQIVEIYVSVSGDPEGLDELSAVVQRLLDDIGSGGISEAEFDDALAELKRQYDLFDNESLATVLAASVADDKVYSAFIDARDTLSEATLAALRTFAERVVTDAPIEVRVTGA